MADEKPTLHIDSDWKKQAQEEKRKLAEEAAAKAKAPPAAASSMAGSASAAPAGSAAGARQRGEMPVASFATIVQSMLTQALYYLGDLASRGGEPMINLDMAKYQIDCLGVLEDKTKGNLSEAEQRLLDTALYEVRMRYVNVASQMIA
jgi:Domain of unknown function (DUF1844)